MPKLLRITTVPISLNILLKGQLAYMQANGYQVITASAKGPEVDEVVAREGVEHYPIQFTRTLSPFKDLYALYQLIRLIRKEKPDIVHTHTPKAGLLGMMAARFCGVKVRMHTVAGMPLMEATGFLKKILSVTEEITYACAHKVYPNSYQLKNWMIKHLSAYQSKFGVIGKGSSNGISLQHFNSDTVQKELRASLKKELAIPSSSLIFVFIGRLVEDKGIHELIDAFESIDEDVHLLLVGPFEDEREPIQQAYKDRILHSKRIHHVGFQSDIRPYLAVSDIFVFPSYREGFPNVVLQAAAMGLPSIVSNINGSNEIIEDHVNGLIVPVKNTEALASGMVKLAFDQSLRKTLAENSRKSVKQKYEQEYVWLELCKEYQQLLKS